MNYLMVPTLPRVVQTFAMVGYMNKCIRIVVWHDTRQLTAVN